MKRLCCTLTVCVLGHMMVSACDDSGSSPNGGSDVQTGPVSAAEVTAVSADSINATNVQSWLDSLLQRLETQETTVIQLSQTVAVQDGRIEELESKKPTITPPTAGDVSFDDTKTVAKGGTVQAFGEEVDQDVANLVASHAKLETGQSALQQELSAAQEGLDAVVASTAELEQDTSDLRFAKNIMVESLANPEPETAIPGKYDNEYDNRVRGAFKLTWKYLVPLLDLTAQPCPPEMALVEGAFCVDKKRYTTGNPGAAMASWKSAALFCASDKKRLCSPAEFMNYCTYPWQYLDPNEFKGSPGSTELVAPEWMDQVGMNGPTLLAFIGSGIGCQGVQGVAADSSNNFRCCKTPNPTTAK